MTTEKEKLLNKINLLMEYLGGLESDKPLSVWNGIQILNLLKRTVDEIAKIDDMLDNHIDSTKAY